MQRTMFRWGVLGALAGLAAGMAPAQTVSGRETAATASRAVPGMQAPVPGALPIPMEQGTELARLVEAAWALQPEALAAGARARAGAARREIAGQWTAEPPAVSLSAKTDRFNGREGAREYEAGIALPLWLPGERAHTARLADAEEGAEQGRLAAARLRTAGQVREAWWQWLRAEAVLAQAQERLTSAEALAADVARRVRAGDLALVDRHQADGAMASAQAGVAEAEGALEGVRLALGALVATEDLRPAPAAQARRREGVPEPVPTASEAVAAVDAHPELIALRRKAEVARRAAELASVQERANPELALLTTRDRGARGEAYRQSATVALRIPFGGGSRHEARVASALAEAMEAEAQLEREQARVRAQAAAARARHSAAQAQWEAAQKREALAAATRGFVQKSFALGETDLPTRLRIEQEAADAARDAVRARLDRDAAVSGLRQALGLLPPGSPLDTAAAPEAPPR
ncbi:TolC family protein [Acidovorax sp. PRC11]|uniref:TolC family protein n=1 Tax=Acidovorax sp. PRC11 TaxID=2962592 RepID=UPI0028824312|nr:TolC family protein [Acidovorax sp. PRC11]MDT0137108.1 TolC family protein [Acidovorax sp. PRC11]